MNHQIDMFNPFMSNNAIKGVVKVLKSGFIGEGKYVELFEKNIAQVINSKYVVTLNSGTSALHLSLILAGIKEGDEVITTAQTMLATSLVILQQKAKPIFADINYLTGNIDPKDIEHRITPRTKAILIVHWGGYPCDLDEIHSIAKKYNLIVIEDAAHALGATYHNKPIGSLSPFTCFSFQAIKHITSVDGGAISLTNKELFQKAKRLRWFGIDRVKRKPSELGEPKFNVFEVGYKYHMNDVNAVIGLENLKYLNKIIKKRLDLAKIYTKYLKKIKGIKLFENKSDRQNAYWLYNIHVENRIQFIRLLKSNNISCSVVHQRIDKNQIFKYSKNLQSLNKFTKTHICLPIHHNLNKDHILNIIKVIKKGW